MDEIILKKNDEIIVKIERLGDNGEGIATNNGKVIFVPFALPGEEAKVHIIFDKKNYFVAKLIEIISPSNDRINPPCPYFSKCGGCDLQHLSCTAELEFKQSLVSSSLHKYAGINHKVLSVVESDKEFRYRNKFAFPVCEEDGQIKIGMYRKNSHKIIEIDDCLLQSENAKIIISLFKKYMQENKISAYREDTKKGTIKHIVVRENNDEFILTVVVTDKKFNSFEPLINLLKTKFKSFGIYKNINTFNSNVIFGNQDTYVYGLKELGKEDFDVKYNINNRSFLQVNDYIKNTIYQKIIDLCKDDKVIIDAYSGAGLLSSILAKNAEKVYGVEIVGEATKNAENLKLSNNLYNLTNINGDCSEVIPRLAKEIKTDFTIVLDPPRKGVDKSVLEAILKSTPSKIVYLSCNPSTLARDLKMLCEKYDLEFVQPYNMFPKTSNVETLVSLKLKR